MVDTAAIFARTGVVRLFKSYNLAQAVFPGFAHGLFTRSSEIKGRIAPDQQRKLFDKVLGWAEDRGGSDPRCPILIPLHRKWFVEYGKYPEDIPAAIWELAFTYGDWTRRVTLGNEEDGAPAARKAGYTVDLEACRRLIAQVGSGALNAPRQSVAIAQVLVNEGFDFFTAEELQALTRTVRFIVAMKTKQDPWRIMRYYSPLLVQYGCITVP